MPRAQIKDEPMNSNIYLAVGLSPFRHQARESSESLDLLGVPQEDEATNTPQSETI